MEQSIHGVYHSHVCLRACVESGNTLAQLRRWSLPQQADQERTIHAYCLQRKAVADNSPPFLVSLD